MPSLGNVIDEMHDGSIEVAARIAERTEAFDDAINRGGGCATTGERIAARIRALKRGNEHHKWLLENEPEAFDPPQSGDTKHTEPTK